MTKGQAATTGSCPSQTSMAASTSALSPVQDANSFCVRNSSAHVIAMLLSSLHQSCIRNSCMQTHADTALLRLAWNQGRVAHPDGSTGDTQLGLRLHKHIVPQARLQVALHLGQIEVGACRAQHNSNQQA
jgi:hypothetical protein